MLFVEGDDSHLQRERALPFATPIAVKAPQRQTDIPWSHPIAGGPHA
jgi:hypothetical protein